MAYLVLARKYRPQRFEDVTGQEHVVRTLSHALSSGRVAHAYLFTGPRGCGKTTSARLLAKALNCEKGPTPTPCGTCSPCTEIAAGTDIDVQELDAASNRGVDDVRMLREAAKYLPARDRHKVFIIDEVHMLTDAAANALLKTLEEPPGHVKFILATTDPQKLPATILSRCQRHGFRLVPMAQLVDRLSSICNTEGVKAEPAALTLVARQAAGSMRDALSLLEQVISSAAGEAVTEADATGALGAIDRRAVLDFATALVKRDAATALSAIGSVVDAGHDPRRLAEEAALALRNMLATLTPGAPVDAPEDEARILAQAARGAEAVHVARLFDLMQAAMVEVADRSANPRYALEAAALRAVHLASGVGLAELIARTEKLSERLGGAPATTTAAAPVPPTPGAPPYPKDEAAPIAPRPTIAADAPVAAQWAALVEALRVKKRPLASHLEKAIPISMTASTIEIGFREAFFREKVEEPEARTIAETIFSETLGRRVTLKIVALPAEVTTTSVSLADTREKAQRESVAQKKKAVREDPIVREAMRVLNGEIEDVKEVSD